MFASPFSASHDWQIEWKRVPSNFKPTFLSGINDEKALKAIASIGVIGGAQLSRLFLNGNKTKLKKLAGRGLVMRHEIKRENKSFPVFTLGGNGAKLFYLEPNYWVTFDVKDVLRRLVFFKLFSRFREEGMEPSILPAPQPFTGALGLGKKTFYVYVDRGSVEDLLIKLKWERFRERIIMVTENLNHLWPLKSFLNDLSLRVTTDERLMGKRLNQMFYRWNRVKQDWEMDVVN